MDNARLPGTWLLEAFQRGGVDIEALTRSMPDEVDTLLHRMNALSPDSVNRLLTQCAELSNDQDFGLTMNERVDTSMFGVFGYLLLNSSTVKDLLGYMERYHSIFYSAGTFFRINTRQEMVSISYGREQPTKYDTRHQTEWALGFTPYYLGSLLGEEGIPASAYFTHSAPSDLQKLQSIFGHDLHFNQAENKLVYPETILKSSLSGTSPSLLKILCQEAEALLHAHLKSDSLDKKVRLLLFEGLEHHNANASDIARELHMSLSTFKRRLVQKNINFKKLKETVKNELAIKLLSTSEVSLFEIAMRIGFSGQSSFSHFFVRCNGMTPQKFREKNQGD